MQYVILIFNENCSPLKESDLNSPFSPSSFSPPPPPHPPLPSPPSKYYAIISPVLNSRFKRLFRSVLQKKHLLAHHLVSLHSPSNWRRNSDSRRKPRSVFFPLVCILLHIAETSSLTPDSYWRLFRSAIACREFGWERKTVK